MTALLVSVRSVKEALAALVGGTALIDIKEPDRGALGAADAATVGEIVAAVAGRAPVSAALGELAELTDARVNETAAILATPGLSYAKIGLAGMANEADWRTCWRRVVAQFPPSVRPVAVVYADARLVGAPSFDEVLPLACELRCAALLVDTFDKTNGTLFDHLSDGELAESIYATHDAGLLSVIGGSLSNDSIRRAAVLAPDYVAVRTAACVGGRRGRVDAERVRSLVEMIGRTNDAPRPHGVRRQFQIR